jgi:hypothetical protein
MSPYWLLLIVPASMLLGAGLLVWAIVRAVDKVTDNGEKPWRLLGLFGRWL